jgi:hypothetical protein
MGRATKLGSYAERRKIAAGLTAGLTALLDLAAIHQRGSRYHIVRHQLALEHQESLRALANASVSWSPSMSPASRNSS